MDLVNDISKRFEAKYQQLQTPWIGEEVPDAIVAFCKQLKLESKTTVLDLGCGDGWIAIYLAQQGLTVTGIDSSKTAIRQAEQNSLRAGVQNETDYILQNALDFQSNNKKFDAIVDRGLLHHIPEENWPAYHRVVSENIKHDGLLYLGVFSDKSDKKGFSPKRDGKMWNKVKDDSGHWTYDHFFDTDLIKEIFKDGWVVERCEEDQKMSGNGSLLLNCVLHKF